MHSARSPTTTASCCTRTGPRRRCTTRWRRTSRTSWRARSRRRTWPRTCRLTGRSSTRSSSSSVAEAPADVAVPAETVETTAGRGRRVARRAPGEPRNVAWLYILPELSFFDWDGLTVGHYVGLANYREAFSDPLVRESFKHSAELILFYAVLPVILGLLLTALLTRYPVRGFTFYRTALFLPQMVAGVVVAQAWFWIYADNEPLNSTLRDVGLGALTRPWLGDFTWAL